MKLFGLFCAVAAWTLSSVASAAPREAAQTLTGRWRLNDTHTFYLEETRNGAINGYVTVESLPEFSAEVHLRKRGPGYYEGFGSQSYQPGGCLETFYVNYRVIDSASVLVNLTGSDGACGAPRDFRMTYQIDRDGVAGVWRLNDTHRFYLSEDSFGHVTGSVTVVGLPGYTAEIDMQRMGELNYEGQGSQRSTPGGCTETYFVTYTLLSPRTLQVDINGSTGACGIDPDFQASYQIERVL